MCVFEGGWDVRYAGGRLRRLLGDGGKRHRQRRVHHRNTDFRRCAALNNVCRARNHNAWHGIYALMYLYFGSILICTFSLLFHFVGCNHPYSDGGRHRSRNGSGSCCSDLREHLPHTLTHAHAHRREGPRRPGNGPLFVGCTHTCVYVCISACIAQSPLSICLKPIYIMFPHLILTRSGSDEQRNHRGERRGLRAGGCGRSGRVYILRWPVRLQPDSPTGAVETAAGN